MQNLLCPDLVTAKPNTVNTLCFVEYLADAIWISIHKEKGMLTLEWNEK